MYTLVVFGYILGIIGPIRGLLTGLEYSNNDLYHMIQQMNKTIADLQQENLHLKQQMAMNNRVASSVAFAAYMTQTVDNAAIGHIIRFDHILINEGNGYNGNDGIFVCPKAGLYLFTYNIYLVGTSKQAGVTLKVNGQSFMNSYEVTDGTLLRANAADTTVHRLKAGDHVWLAFTVPGSHIYGSTQSNFAGVLLA